LDANEKNKEGEQKASAGTITGPFRVYVGETIDPVLPLRFAITRQKKTNSSREQNNTSEMGVQQFIEYGLYRVNGCITPHLCAKTGLTFGDVLKIFACIQQMCEVTKSASKSNISVARLDVWTHPSELGYNDFAFDTLKVPALSTLDTPVSATSFADYASKITLDEKAIAAHSFYHVEIAHTPDLLDMGMKVFQPEN
jgi:Cas7 group CRISPR-associated protein Csh2